MAQSYGIDLSVGSILARTKTVTTDTWLACLLFVVVISTGGTLTDWLFTDDRLFVLEEQMWGGLTPWLSGISEGQFTYFMMALYLLLELIALIFIYFLMRVMLRSENDPASIQRTNILAYLGQWIVMSTAILFGAILIIVPGIFLMLRWSVAQPILIGKSAGILASMRTSWELTRGHAFPIFVAGAVLVLPFFVIVVIVASSFAEDELPSIIVSQVAERGFSVILSAFSVALFGLLDTPAVELEEVFA